MFSIEFSRMFCVGSSGVVASGLVDCVLLGLLDMFFRSVTYGAEGDLGSWFLLSRQGKFKS